MNNKLFTFLLSLLFVLSAVSANSNTYYSLGNGNFSLLSNWNTATDGSGSQPTLADLSSGTHDFVIQNGNIITLDLDASVNKLSLQSSDLIIGNSTTARNLVVNSDLTLTSGSDISIGAFNAAHQLELHGNLSNNGSMDLFTNSAQYASLSIAGNSMHSGNAPDLYHLTISSGTFTLGADLIVNGNVNIDNGAVLAAANYNLDVNGNWTENGNGQLTSNATVKLLSNTVQQITSGATFHHLEMSGGGVVSLAANININGNLTISNNSSLITSNSVYAYGDIQIANGSKIQASNGVFYIYGSNAQTLTISNTTEFDRVYFRYGGVANPKTLVGDLIARDYVIILNQAHVVGNGSHVFYNGMRIDGSCNLSGTVKFKGGTLSDSQDNDFSFGTAELIVEGGVSIATNNTLRLQNNLTITSGSIVVNAGSQIIQEASNKTLSVGGTADLYIRGANNFPTGFATIELNDGSDVRYDGQLAQSVPGGLNYYNLYVRYGYTKTTTGNLNIKGSMYIQNGAIFDLSNFAHTIGANLSNAGTLNSTGSVSFIAGTSNQTLSGNGTYNFHDLNFANPSPTTTYTKNIDANINVNGDFSISNGSSSTTNQLTLDIDANSISNDGGDSFTLGENVRLLTSGANSLHNSLASFNQTSLHTNSIVRYDGSAQTLANVSYGHVELHGSAAKSLTGDITIKNSINNVGGTPILTDNGNTIQIEGDWLLESSYTTGLTGTVRFTGNNQNITSGGFHHVSIEGSQTKTLTNNITVRGNLNIADNTTLDANDENITIYGNWMQTANGIFIQTGRTTFSGSQDDIQLTTNTNSYFGQLYINKTGGNKTVITNTDLKVNDDLYFTQNNAVLNMNGNDLYVGDNWYYHTGTNFIHGQGKLYFNGNGDQYIYNYKQLQVQDIEFAGSGQKYLRYTDLDVEGDLTIQAATLNAGSYDISIYLAGDWINNGNFSSDRPVYFDGANQSIGGSSFHDVYIRGTGTKTLAGNINLTGHLIIEDAVTLDVSTNNYDITLEENWDNSGSGVFVARNATVTFVGNNSNMYSGGAGADKDFYNLVINQGAANRLYLQNTIRIEKDFTLSSGYFRTGANSMSVGGNFTNTSGLFEHNNNGSILTLNATSGNIQFNPGGDNFRTLNITSSGAYYTLEGDLSMSGSHDLTITNANVDFNGKNINLSDYADINLISGTLDISEGTHIVFGRNGTLNNHGGNLNIVGSQSNIVTLSSNQTSTSRYFKITQTAGTLAANHYRFEKLGGNGVDVQGGSIHSTHNFSNGTLINGGGTSYFTLTGVNLGSGITIDNVNFGSGPNYNITRTSGTGAINLTNCIGALAGEAFEQDNGTPGTLINWVFNGDFYWDGGAGTNAWNDAANWVSNAVPSSLNNVVLDHSYVSGSYTVEISGTDAIIDNLEINGGSNGITLNLNGADLDINQNLQVSGADELGILQTSDDLRIAGNLSIGGSLNAIAGTVTLKASSGTKTIDCSDHFFNLTLDASGATYVMASHLNIKNNFSLANGTLDVSSSNFDIYIGGNWNLSGASFNKRFGEVIFNGNGGGSQSINGGSFYDISFRNGSGSGTSTKTTTSNLTVEDDIRIESGVVFDASTHIVFVGDDWLNSGGSSAFTQSGSGAVIFNGGTQLIGDYSSTPTQFNNVYFQGTGNKEARQGFNVTKDMTLVSGVGSLVVHDGVTINGNGGSNNFTQSGATLQLRGANNFPTGFEQINLTGGTVLYYSNSNQSIYPTTYNNLDLRRINSGNSQTKTISNDLVVNGNLVVNDAETTLDVAGHTVTVYGVIGKATGSPAIQWNNGTFIWNNPGNVAFDPDITNFHHIVFNAAGTKYLNNDLTITGNVTIQNSAYVASAYNNVNHTFNAAGSGQSFTLAANCRYYAYDQAASGKAFPQNYAQYNLDPNSTVYIRATSTLNGSQTIYTAPQYGNLYIFDNTSRTITLDGDLKVKGDLRMQSNNPTLADGGFDIDAEGSYIDLRNYTPSATSTFTLSGSDQDIYDNGSNVLLELNNIVFSGNGTKTIRDISRINGDLTIQSGATLINYQNLDFYGSSWINNGNANFTGGTTHFQSNSTQNINPGANHSFYHMQFSGSGTKTIVNNGLDVNGNFLINTGTVDFGSYDHYISSPSMTNNGTLISSDANIYFDYASGNQTLCAITAKAVFLTTTGNRYKTITGNWDISSISIGTGVTFRSAVSSPGNNITVHGDWLCDGSFQALQNTVSFEPASTGTYTIKTNTSDFYNVEFNKTNNQTVSYQTIGDMEVDENFTLGNNATLLISNNDLRLGDNTNVETHTVESGAVLSIGAGSVLKVNAYAGDAQVDILGELQLVGTSSSSAWLTRSNGNYRIDIEIQGKISARYYQIEYLCNEGLKLAAGCTIDATNNLSDGVFSNMSTSGSAAKRYIDFQNNTSSLTSISNVSFNYGGTPQAGRNYNVRKNASAAGNVTFTGSITGNLAGEVFEDDPAGKVFWPSVSQVQWVGSVSSDWFNPANWSPAVVPSSTIDVIIPSASNYPIINNNNANCKNLSLTNGILSLDAGFDLNIAEDVVLGTGNSTAILSIANSTCELFVGGDWTSNSNSIFTHGNATVNFIKPSGSASITPRSNAFYNVILNGNTSFNFYGTSLNVDGGLTLTAGEFNPRSNNYILNLKGDLINSGGSMNASTAGTLKLLGTTQDLSKVNTYRLQVGGTGTKTFSGSNTVNSDLTIDATMTMASGASLTIKGNTTINSGATFNDGNGTHYFSGTSWYGTGTYSGNGTIEFTGGNTYVYASNFHNLNFNGNGRIYLKGDIDVTGDVYFHNSINQVYAYDKLINNTSGTGTFTLESGEYIHILGASNFPSNFSQYTIDPSSYVYYSGTSDQNIAGVEYGHLVLRNNTTKTLTGDVTVKGNLYFYESTLDVSSLNYGLEIQGNWYNQNTGSFICRNGEVSFTGGSNRQIQMNGTGTNDFFKVTINKSSSSNLVYPYNTAMTILSDLRVFKGIFSAYGQTVTIGGEMNATNGTFATSGSYVLTKASGTTILQVNGSVLNHLTIQSSGTGTVELQDQLSLNGNLTVAQGTFNGNGQTVNAGDNGDQVNIAGKYIIGQGGTIALGDNVTLTIQNGATFEAIGALGNPATITRRGNGRYNFNVEGFIRAKHYIFKFMSSAGIYLKSTSSIDPVHNFSEGTFDYGTGGGTMLRIENNNSLIGANSIKNVKFLTNPGYGASNVMKSNATSGTLEFFNAQGSFSGESYDNDPNSLINWTGDVILTWDGSKNTNWFDAENWTPSSGPEIVPTGNEEVVIAAATNQPIIDASGAITENLEIQSGAVLSLNTPGGTAVDLKIKGDLELKGTLIVSQDDIIELDGYWRRTGSFNCGTGKVIMTNSTGTATINNGTVPFYNMDINATNSISILCNTLIQNNLNIQSGTLAVSSSNFYLRVNGSISNSGTYTHNNSKLVLGATSGSHTLNLGSSDVYYLRTVAGNANYTVSQNDLHVTHTLRHNGGTLDLGTQDLHFGSGSSSNAFVIAGTLNINDGNNLRMAENSALIVDGGELNVISSNASNPATIRNQGSGYFSFTLSSGAIIAAKHYLISHTDANGLRLRSGTQINSTNNFSYGTFSNGHPGGYALNLENDFSDFTATEVVFNSGANYNVKRTSGNGNITFMDASGVKAGHLHEQDDASATTGRVRWTYSNTNLTWVGAISSDWDNVNNWSGGLPSANTIVTIPDVGSNYDPVISNSHVEMKSLSIASGGVLTLQSDKNLSINGDFNNSGTLNVNSSSASTLSVSGNWSNAGTFTPGNLSTVEFNAASGVKTINHGSSQFNNLTVNSNGTYQTASAISINNNLTVTQGSFVISQASHTLQVGGDISNNGTLDCSCTVLSLNGGNQDISSVVGETVSELVLSGSGTKSLSADLVVEGDINIGSNTTLNAGSHTLSVSGNWNNSGSFEQASSTVVLNGTSLQRIDNPSEVNFHNLTINNTSATYPQIILDRAVRIKTGGVLTLTDGVVETSSTHILTMESGTSVSGGSNGNAYIDGPMVKIGNQNFIFPIGDGTIFARIGISGMTNTGTFKAQYFDQAYSNVDDLHTDLDRVSNVEYWDLSRTSGTATPNVTLYWENGTRSGVDDIDEIKVAHFEGGMWMDMGAATTGNISAGTVMSTVGFTSFSPITFAFKSSDSGLPVELLSFEATKEEDEVRLDWTTLSETNNDFFTIERSQNGSDFEAIGTADGQGTSLQATDYTFVDMAPLNGVSYYRLKQTDFDGTTTYSDVRQIRFEAKEAGFSLYPNPSTGSQLTLRFKGFNEGQKDIRIVNSSGQLVYKGTSQDGQHTLNLNTYNLTKGFYMVIVSNDHQKAVQKLTVL